MYRHSVVLTQFISDTVDKAEDNPFHDLLKGAQYVRLQQERKSGESTFFSDSTRLPKGGRGAADFTQFVHLAADPGTAAHFDHKGPIVLRVYVRQAVRKGGGAGEKPHHMKFTKLTMAKFAGLTIF